MANISAEARKKAFQDLYSAISKATITDNGATGGNLKIVNVPYNGTLQDLFKKVAIGNRTIAKFMHAVVALKLFKVTDHGNKGVTIERLHSGIYRFNKETNKNEHIIGFDLIPFIMSAASKSATKEEPEVTPAIAAIQKEAKKVLTVSKDVSALTDDELAAYGKQADEDEVNARSMVQNALFRKNQYRIEVQKREKRRKAEEEARKKTEEEANILKSRKEFLARLKETARASGIPWEELMKLDGVV